MGWGYAESQGRRWAPGNPPQGILRTQLSQRLVGTELRAWPWCS